MEGGQEVITEPFVIKAEEVPIVRTSQVSSAIAGSVAGGGSSALGSKPMFGSKPKLGISSSKPMLGLKASSQSANVVKPQNNEETTQEEVV